MPEILTESFCERCGTRYTFQSTTPKVGRMAKMKTLSRGLKNYVLSDDASLDEALADARSTDDRQQSVEQLDAFHKTFNFCMSCRQYTCANCWNEREGRCLSCAPGMATSAGVSTFPELNPVSGLAGLGAHGNGHAAVNGHAEPATWPADGLSDEGPAISRLEALFGRTAAEPLPNGEDTANAEVEAADGSEPGPRKPELIGLEEAVAAHEVDLDLPATDEFGTEAGATIAALVAAEDDEGAEAAATAAEAAAVASTDEAGPVVPDLIVAAIADLDAVDEAAAANPDVTEDEAAAAAAEIQKPVVHAIDPETDDLAAAAAAQTAQLLDRFRANPMVIPAQEPRPVVDVPLARPTSPPTPLPLPYAASAGSGAPAAPASQPQVPAPAPSYAPPPYGGPALPYAAGPYSAAQPPYGPATPQYPPAMPYAPTPPPYTPPAPQYAAPQAPAYPPAAPVYPQQAAPVYPPAAPTAAPYAAAPPPYADPAYQQYPAVQPQYPVPAAPAQPQAPRPSWRMVAPETPVQSQAANGRGYEGPAPEPEWPSAPQWPAPVAGKSRDHAADAVWAESTRDLLNKTETGVSACFNCGLPLSATARFCRRCGTSQVSS